MEQIQTLLVCCFFSETNSFDAIYVGLSVCSELQYLQLPNISVGNHAYEKRGAEETALAVCQQFYKRGTICPGNDTFDIDPEIVTGNKPNILF